MIGAGAAKTGSLRIRLGGVAEDDDDDDDELQVNLAENEVDLTEEEDFFREEALRKQGAKAEAVDICHKTIVVA